MAMCLLLLGTAAPALVRMNCLSSGRSVLSIGQASDCCPPAQDAPKNARLGAVCCEFTKAMPSHAAFHVRAVPVHGPIMAHVSPTWAHVASMLMNVPVDYRPVAHPPPLLIAERLSRIGLLLI